MLRAVIIDDEPAGIKAIRHLAERTPHLIKIIATSQYADEGTELIENYKPDVVFLDIHLPDMDGFELLSKLSFHDFKLVFTTAHDEHAIKAIKNNAFDYLLKPIHDADFKHCIDRMALELKKEPAMPVQSPHLFIELRAKDGVIYIKQKQIIRMEACGSYTEIHLDNGTRQTASKGLGEFEPRLDPSVFYRCHKSHIINLHKVQKFVNHDGFYAQMNDGSMVDVSKHSKDDFLQRVAMM